MNKEEHATYSRKMYHTNKEYRRRRNEASKKWSIDNREKVNASYRKVYAEMSEADKEIRLMKVRDMRDLGLWKK